MAGKPPIGEVAEVLCEYGVQPDSEPGPGEGGQRPQPDSGPPAPDLMISAGAITQITGLPLSSPDT